MNIIEAIYGMIGFLVAFCVAFAAGYYRGEASTLNARMDAYEQGKRDGYWDAWQRDPEGVKAPKWHITMTKDRA